MKTAFSAAVSMSTPLDKIFEETINNCYSDFRWLDTYTSDDKGRVFNGELEVPEPKRNTKKTRLKQVFPPYKVPPHLGCGGSRLFSERSPEAILPDLISKRFFPFHKVQPPARVVHGSDGKRGEV